MYSHNSKIDRKTVTQLNTLLASLLATNDLVLDSRKLNKNGIFCAYPGGTNDGRQFIDAAILRGANFILWECGIDFTAEIPNLAVDNLMHYVGLLAAIKYDYPSTKFKTIGVTGTNGKTSITHWLNQAYRFFNQVSGIIGTTGAGIYPDIVDYEATTPNPITLQAILAEFAAAHAQMVALEVSSHALDQGRVNGVCFTTAIFTNLTIDHMDYHQNMENYYQAKRELFYWHDLNNALINTDDEYGLRLVNELKTARHNLMLLSYGINSGELRANKIKINLRGMEFGLSYQKQEVLCHVKVIGKFNVYNLLAVAGALILDGYTLPEIARMLTSLTPVCGRMETLMLPGKPLVVIDYSHTPDSLHNALTTLKQVEHNGKLYCVFGCGGNRDKTKRPLMGDIATQIADYVIVTSDNPRFEEPEAIIEEIKLGVKKDNYMAITDRGQAIQHILEIATAGDIVLIAGKGHETYQEIKGVKTEFSDFTIASGFLTE